MNVDELFKSLFKYVNFFSSYFRSWWRSGYKLCHVDPKVQTLRQNILDGSSGLSSHQSTDSHKRQTTPIPAVIDESVSSGSDRDGLAHTTVTVVSVHFAPPPALSACVISGGYATALELLWDNGWVVGWLLTALETFGLDFSGPQLCHCLLNLEIGMCHGYLNQPPPAITLYTDWGDNCNSWTGIRRVAPASVDPAHRVTVSHSQAEHLSPAPM